ncbi:MAG: glycosyltransferase family 39 protein [Flavobacteriales bacterium]
MKTKLLPYLSDIRFWILLTFLIKGIGITDPPIEIGHNWRQTTVAMVARNFLEIDNNILYPRIDIAGEKSGITGMEFPIFNYLIYLISLLFGYEHWYGRIINLIISSFGSWYFYKLIIRFFNPKIAFNATLILLFSIWFSYSRKIMPDTFAVSLVIAGMYYSSNYLEKRTLIHLLIGSFLIGLGVLSKLPAGVVLSPFVWLLFSNKIKTASKITFGFILGLFLIPSLFWYFYWVPYLNTKFEFWHFFMGKSLGTGLSEFLSQPSIFIEKFYGTTLFYLGFIACLIGLYFMIKTRHKLLLATFAISLGAIVIILLKSGLTFAHHTYYMIPFVPAMALLAGYGLSKIPSPVLSILLLVGIASEGILNQQVDFRIPEKHLEIMTLEQDLDEFSSPSDLILINSGFVPTPMYIAHRKGWVEENESILNEELIQSKKMKGLKLIVVLKEAFGTHLTLPYKKLKENEKYIFYSLSKQ